MTDLKVDPEALRLHAGHIEMSASDVDTAAAATATCSDDAFGVLCSFLPPIINTFWPTNTGAIRDAAQSLRHAAQSLRSAANDLESTDTDVAGRARRMESRLGGGQ